METVWGASTEAPKTALYLKGMKAGWTESLYRLHDHLGSDLRQGRRNKTREIAASTIRFISKVSWNAVMGRRETALWLNQRKPETRRNRF